MQHLEPSHHSVILTHPSRETEKVEIAYYEWGAQNANIVFCVHGLSRNGRDFDYLASALAADYRVISIDLPGRGKSPHLLHKEDYNYGFNAKILGAFLEKLSITRLDWVGTSMGGILGMMLAAFRPSLTRKLVLNDIGAFVDKEGLGRIAHYLGKPLLFSNRTEAEAYMRTNYTSFGLTEDWQWQHVFTHSIVAHPEGGFTFAYDPAIIDEMRTQSKNFTEIKDVDLWPLWKLVVCPALILRGKDSEIISPATALRMQERPAPTELYEVPHVGHAPALMDELQVGRIREFLLSSRQAPPIGWLSKTRAWCIRKLLPILIKR